MAGVIISQQLLDELIAHALDEAPLECCGLIACRRGEAERVYRCVNVAESEFRYEIDGAAQFVLTREFEGAGMELGAIYHSHTLTDPVPSESDIELAFYPDALYVIVGVRDPDWPEVKAWSIVDGQVQEAQLQRG